MSVNKVILIGRLGRDPEIRHTSSGAAVCNFSIATDENWTDKSGVKQEKTEWHEIVVWGKPAEIANNYLKKGRQVYVEGKMELQTWEGQNGEKRSKTVIKANSFVFLGGRNDSRDEGQSTPAQGGSSPRNDSRDEGQSTPAQGGSSQLSPQYGDDDIPF